MASRSDVELEDEAALMLQPEGLGASAVAAFEEEEAAEAHRSTIDEWWNLPPYNENQSRSLKGVSFGLSSLHQTHLGYTASRPESFEPMDIDCSLNQIGRFPEPEKPRGNSLPAAASPELREMDFVEMALFIAGNVQIYMRPPTGYIKGENQWKLKALQEVHHQQGRVGDVLYVVTPVQNYATR
ncbi:hypothetical protein YC2023_045460 [Brassica napus]